MSCVEFCDEIIVVSVTVGHSLKNADLVVDAFERPRRDRDVVPVEDPGLVALQSIGHRLQDLFSRNTPPLSTLTQTQLSAVTPGVTFSTEKLIPDKLVKKLTLASRKEPGL